MIERLKKLTLTFLLYFFFLGVFGLWTWIKYTRDVSQNGGGEMADTIFLLGLIVATVYYGLITIWTFRLYRQRKSNKSGTTIQLTAIFFLGICSSLYGLYKIYN